VEQASRDVMFDAGHALRPAFDTPRLDGDVLPGVVGEVPVEPLPGLTGRLVRVNVHLLPFDRPPESFDEGVIQSSTAPIHADAHPFLQEPAGKLHAGELGSLVGIENLGCGACQSMIQGFHTKVGSPSYWTGARPAHSDCTNP
jgi:hypothetical protein